MMDTEPTFMEITETNILYLSRALRLLFDLHKRYFWNYWEDMKKLYVEINEDPKLDKRD